MPGLTVAVVASGEMGGAIGSTLAAKGARLITNGTGRSETSLARARKAGFEFVDTDDELVAQADILMSVVPPNAAPGLAARFAPAMSQARRRPIFIDCNAVAPRTVQAIAEIIEPTGAKFLDGALFGGPTSGKPGVALYLSGPHAQEARVLGEFGLRLSLMDGPVGAASAMKLSFAALNKGFTAIGALACLAAIRSQSQGALLQELEQTQPGILAYVSRFVPAMYPKAHRWAPEMEEIAAFLEDDAEGREIFQAFARLYARLAQAAAPVEQDEMLALRAFCRTAAERRAAPPVST